MAVPTTGVARMPSDGLLQDLPPLEQPRLSPTEAISAASAKQPSQARTHLTQQIAVQISSAAPTTWPPTD